MPYSSNFRGSGHVCEQLAQGRCPGVQRRGVEPATGGVFSCAGSLAGACMRHGGQQVVQLNAPLQGAGKMAEVNIGCVPKLYWINLTGRNLSARPFLNYFRAGLQSGFTV